MNIREKVITKELNSVVERVVSDNAEWGGDGYYVDWHKVAKDDQDQIISIMVDRDGKDFLAIGENDESHRDDILAKLVSMIKSDTHESDLDFAESVKKAARHYYEDQAIELVDEFAGYYTHDTLRDRGLCLVQDRNHGDYIVQSI